MSSTDVTRSPAAPTEPESTTRERILRLVAEEGPVSVVELARDLALTTAGVRRHVAALEDAGQIVAHTGTLHGPAGRGRPARRFVATDRGQQVLTSAYGDLAEQALRFVAELGGDAAVQAFAERRVGALETRLGSQVVGGDTVGRVAALAAGLATDGYATSVRPVPGGRAVQLCQGHCPVQEVAAQFPALCEAETQMFSRLLGVHVQRLSTLAAGGHVCTTHVPVPPSGGPAAVRAGSEGRTAAMEGQR